MFKAAKYDPEKWIFSLSITEFLYDGTQIT